MYSDNHMFWVIDLVRLTAIMLKRQNGSKHVFKEPNSGYAFNYWYLGVRWSKAWLYDNTVSTPNDNDPGKNAHKRLLVTALLTWTEQPKPVRVTLKWQLIFVINLWKHKKIIAWEIVVYLLETIWGVYWRRREEIEEGKRRRKRKKVPIRMKV
jgi:hypothetical protein